MEDFGQFFGFLRISDGSGHFSKVLWINWGILRDFLWIFKDLYWILDRSKIPNGSLNLLRISIGFFGLSLDFFRDFEGFRDISNGFFGFLRIPDGILSNS